MNRFFAIHNPLIVILSLILLLTGCSNSSTNEIPSDSSGSFVESENTSCEISGNTIQAEEDEAETQVSEIYFSYNTDSTWHTPQLISNQKFPFCINYIVCADNEKVIYVASDLSEVHIVNATTGTADNKYILNKPAEYLLLNENMLYCISTDAIEIWDTATDQRLDIIAYQSSGLNEFYDVSDAMLIDDTLYLLRGSYTMYIQKIALSDGASAFYTFEDGAVSLSENAELEYNSFFLDNKNGRVLAKEDREGIVYCLDVVSDSLKTFDGDWGTEFFVNEVTGTLFMLTKTEDENYSCSISCQTYDEKYNLLNETTWNLGYEYEGMFSSYIPIDVTSDDKLLLMQEGYGSFLLLNTEENDNCKFIENHVRDYSPTALINPECVFISQVDIGAPWKLYNISTDMYQSNSEIVGYCRIAKSKNGFVLYKTNGTVAVYSNSPAENISFLTEKPSVETNPFNGGLWTESNDDQIVAISADGNYKIKRKLTEDEPPFYANHDSEVYCSYWLVDAVTDRELYCIQFPVDSFISIAVKNDSCAAIIKRAFRGYCHLSS